MARFLVAFIGTLLVAILLFSPFSCQKLREVNHAIVPGCELEAC